MRLKLLMGEEWAPDTDCKGRVRESEEGSKNLPRFGLAPAPGECGQQLPVQPLAQSALAPVREESSLSSQVGLESLPSWQ